MATQRIFLNAIFAAGLVSAVYGQCPVQELGSGGDMTRFGRHVSVSGTELLVGTGAGRFAYLYERNADTWERAFRFQNPAPAVGSFFGSFVALSGDIIAIGDPSTDDLYVYGRTATGWALETVLDPVAGG